MINEKRSVSVPVEHYHQIILELLKMKIAEYLECSEDYEEYSLSLESICSEYPKLFSDLSDEDFTLNLSEVKAFLSDLEYSGVSATTDLHFANLFKHYQTEQLSRVSSSKFGSENN